LTGSRQAARVLDMLKTKPHNTLDFRAANIMAPAARVFELKALGWNIVTHKVVVGNAEIALYILCWCL